MNAVILPLIRSGTSNRSPKPRRTFSAAGRQRSSPFGDVNQLCGVGQIGEIGFGAARDHLASFPRLHRDQGTRSAQGVSFCCLLAVPLGCLAASSVALRGRHVGLLSRLDAFHDAGQLATQRVEAFQGFRGVSLRCSMWVRKIL